ncbi:MAG: hypothetical protein OXC02_11835 [Rhodobacteraceae bacterium]|nr:hypothetical protein [Paracoccaceae bacterium]
MLAVITDNHQFSVGIFLAGLVQVGNRQSMLLIAEMFQHQSIQNNSGL